MISKYLTESEFNNLWLRTGKDPNGNNLNEIIIGTENSSYNKYIEFKKRNDKIFIEKKSRDLNKIKELQQRQNYIWRSKDDDKVRSSHLEKDDKIFNWESNDLKPGEDYGCRCYAEFIDNEGKSNGRYGKISWLEKGAENKSSQYFEPTDKNGIPLNKKDWKDLTEEEKELRKLEELDKFKNSDTLKNNIEITKKHKLKFNWFKNQVRGGAEWDYKRNGKYEMEHVGNFNYGATGNALGTPWWILKLGAGGYQFRTGTSKLSFISSGFDDPVDSYFVNEGYDWYDDNY